MKNDNGGILVLAIVLTALLLATALGYFKIGADERYESAYEEATIQAYFLAEQGIMSKGIKYLRTRKPNNLPTATVFLGDGVEPGIGKYLDTKICRVTDITNNNVFQRSDTYDVFSTGEVTFVGGHKVKRSKKLRVKLRSFSNYMYLTNFESTRFNETIWFWGEDTLYGRTHSNDRIGIKGRPMFYGPVSTCAEDFIHGAGYSPYFAIEPVFNAPPVMFPVTAEALRQNANPFIEGRARGMMTRVWFRGSDGILIYQYRLGEGEPSLYDPGEDVQVVAELPPPGWGGIFIDGDCEIYGIVAGKLTVGSSGNMWLMDNICYLGANQNNGYFGNTYTEQMAMPHVLGLISESNIIIKNTWYNGREDGANANRNDQNRHSIVITAAMVALGESFTFEHQNDEWDLYKGPSPDERGTIHLQGAVTQNRRGYAHRSNHNNTGYGKDYHYDFRLDYSPPPYYLDATDENGNGLFDLVEWEELKPEK